MTTTMFSDRAFAEVLSKFPPASDMHLRVWRNSSLPRAKACSGWLPGGTRCAPLAKGIAAETRRLVDAHVQRYTGELEAVVTATGEARAPAAVDCGCAARRDPPT